LKRKYPDVPWDIGQENPRGTLGYWRGNTPRYSKVLKRKYPDVPCDIGEENPPRNPRVLERKYPEVF
jgi:hypothetical protein